MAFSTAFVAFKTLTLTLGGAVTPKLPSATLVKSLIGMDDFDIVGIMFISCVSVYPLRK